MAAKILGAPLDDLAKIMGADIIALGDATVANVLENKTFYAGSTTLQTGTMPTRTLDPANETVNAGYYAATTLSAVDADLLSGNIKATITIFGFVGSDDVRDISDADLVEAEAPTGKYFYAVSGGRRTGTGTKTLSAGSETVQAGYYAATTLSTVDADLATGNIKYNVTIFGFAGSTNVRDTTDADAAVGNVISSKTFYAGGGAKKTGTMPTVALSPTSSAYPTGFHVGHGGGLGAIDGDLNTANIKSGITIFNVSGHTDVRNVSDANALVAEVKSGRTFYAVGGAKKTGTIPTVTITSANDNYPAGYHAGNAGGLDAIDTDLTSANIKYNITIFGKPGSTNVRDSSDATATVSRVRSGYTFYAGGGAKQTGTLATRTLSAGSETVSAGYYAATTLSGVDSDLATGNIKSGITIFGFTGPATVQNISAANSLVAEVKSGRTFFSVTGTIKTGTMLTKAIVAANDLYEAGYHAGNAGGLDAIDVHLAPANIKSGVNIFGKVGTYTGPAISPVYTYYWEGTLSGGSSYTPAVTGMFQAATDNDGMRMEVHGNYWGCMSGRHYQMCAGNGSNFRIRVEYGPYTGLLVRCQLKHSNPTYQVYTATSSAESVWYTVAVTGLFTITSYRSSDGDCNANNYGQIDMYGTAWRRVKYDGDAAGIMPVCIGVAGRLRYRQNFSACYRIVTRWY